jgi:hypothetical protein
MRYRLIFHASSEGRKIYMKSDEVRIWKEPVVGILKGLAFKTTQKPEI